MSRARDPTAEVDSVDGTARTRAIVNAHLAALCGAGDCATALREDVALTMMETGEVTRGRASVATLLSYLHRAAFAAPPAVSTLVVEADRALIEAVFAGRHLGEFAGILPTGRTVRLPYVVAYDLDVATDTIRAMRLYLPLDMLIRQLREI